MKKNGKRKGVSRRDFLKGLGRGAVGAAAISTGLLKPVRLEAAETKGAAKKGGASMPVKVRSGIKEDSAEVKGLNEILSKAILPDFQPHAGQEEILVNCRLNLTERKDPAPVWYGWVESPGLQKRSKRTGPPPKLIGSTHLSPIYSRVLTTRPRDTVHEVDYTSQDVRDAEKTPNAFKHDTTLGVHHRRFIAIVVGNQCVGTLTVGFPKPPSNDLQLKHELRFWAQNPKSKLVEYVKNTFTMGGPKV